MSTSLILLELPGVTGDCSIAGFAGHIALESFSWGVNSTMKIESGPKGKANVSVKCDQLQVSKYYDSSSIQMCNLMGKDKEFETGVILKFVDSTSLAQRANSKFESIMEMELKKVYIENISIRASESGKAMSVTEDVVFSMQEVALRYFLYDPVKKIRIPGNPFEWVAPKVDV